MKTRLEIMKLSAVLLITAAISGAALANSLEPAGNAPGRSLRFVIYGDTRDGHDAHRAVVKLIMEQKPDMVLQTGDLVRRGSENDLWKIYDDITGDMRKKIPVYPSRGNHDFGGAGYDERLTISFTNGNKKYYSFDKKQCHFIALDIDEHEEYKPESTQYQWLIKDLEANKKAKFTFVFFHVPPYSIGGHGSDLNVRAALCPVFQKYHVQGVFNGHDHNYYRTVRDGITYLVSGGGGAPLYPCFPEQKGAIAGDKWETVNHIVVCDLVGDTLKCSAIRKDGTEIEHFTINK